MAGRQAETRQKICIETETVEFHYGRQVGKRQGSERQAGRQAGKICSRTQVRRQAGGNAGAEVIAGIWQQRNSQETPGVIPPENGRRQVAAEPAGRQVFAAGTSQAGRCRPGRQAGASGRNGGRYAPENQQKTAGGTGSTSHLFNLQVARQAQR